MACGPSEMVSSTVPPGLSFAPPPGDEEITAPVGTLWSNSLWATTGFMPILERVLFASFTFIPTTEGSETPLTGPTK